jgi:non-ribosomal peptide synthetase component F
MIVTEANPYEIGLDKNAANYVPLTPIGVLLRSASIYADRLAVAYGERRYSWRATLERCRRLASALAAHGVHRGDTVALIAPNLPEAFEALFGVPMTGAVVNALNIRLDADTIGFILRHGWHSEWDEVPGAERALAPKAMTPALPPPFSSGRGGAPLARPSTGVDSEPPVLAF